MSLKQSWPILAATCVFVTVLGLNYAAGAFTVIQLPRGYSSHLELLGQVIMFSLMAPYLLLAAVYSRRYSLALAANIDTDFARKISTLHWPLLGIGGVLGTANGYFNNLAPGQIEGLANLAPIHTAVSLSNLLTWTTVGVTLTLRIMIAVRFYVKGRHVAIDIFNIGALKPFARNALADILMICGAIGLTMFQALDATFRADNFVNALIVALPALLVLFLLPIYSIHARIKQLKQDELSQIQTLIDAAPRSLETQQMNDLEVLLQRRERVLAAPSWPIDLSMLYRLLFYFVIPPLAWVAAAMVEIYLESSLGG